MHCLRLHMRVLTFPWLVPAAAVQNEVQLNMTLNHPSELHRRSCTAFDLAAAAVLCRCMLMTPLSSILAI